MTRRIIYNDDSQGVGETNPGSAEKDLRAWVDKALTELAIDTYVWCIGFPDIVHYNSKAGEIYGRRFEEPPNQTAKAIAELIEQGTDVLEVVADQTHQHGVEFVAGVRMGDTHLHRADDPAISKFMLDHPEYVINRRDGIRETALDYSHPEVREHRLGILREIAENYAVDGVELDFVRWGKFFARSEAPFKVKIMTDFVGRVRQILDEAATKRGCKRLALGVQVPRSLYLGHLCGLDPKGWVENGWLDYIIQCDFTCTDPEIPVAEFAEFCRGSRCTHHVRMGHKIGGRWGSKPYMTERKTRFVNLQGYGGMVLTVEEARGAAANIYGFGADGIGFWNICCNMGDRHKPGKVLSNISRQEYQHDMLEWAKEVCDPENVRSRERVYHFIPIYKSENVMVRNYAVNALREGPLGEPTQIVVFYPKSQGCRQVYHFLMADGKDGEKLSGTLRVRILQSTLEDKFKFDINSRDIDPQYVHAEAVEDDELPFVWYEVDLAKCPPFSGCNELGMTMLSTPRARQQKDAGPRVYEQFPYMEELVITVDPG